MKKMMMKKKKILEMEKINFKKNKNKKFKK